MTGMSEQRIPTPHPVWILARSIPATLALRAVMLAIGVVFGGLWSPFEDSPLYESVAYGLPALLEGRWWTPVVGTFFVNQPWVYLFTITSFIGMAFLEYRRGIRVALAYFWVGQLFAIFATALVLGLLALTPWVWAQTRLRPSTSAPPAARWRASPRRSASRSRRGACVAWLILLAFVFIAMFYWGELADLEHLMAVLLILFVDRSLRVQRTTVREQRLLAWIGLIVLRVVQIITVVIPTDGPFGQTEPATGGFIDAAIDAVIILFIANGLRRGRRWAWIVAVVLGSLNLLVGAADRCSDRCWTAPHGSKS